MLVSNKMKKVSAAIMALWLSGCGTLANIEQENAAVRDTINTRKQQTASQARPSAGAVERIPHAKIVGKRIELKTAASLPTWLNKSQSHISSSETLSEVLDRISERINVPIKFRTDSATVLDTVFPIQWEEGAVKGLFDHIARRTGSYWKITDAGTVEFFDVETKTFHIALPPGQRTLNSSISLGQASSNNGGNSGGNNRSGGADVKVASDLKIDTFTAVLRGVETIVDSNARTSNTSNGGAGGGNVAVSVGSGVGASVGGSGSGSSSSKTRNVEGNAELGMITVTAPPPVIEKVQVYVDAVNERFAQNVLIQIKVLEVTLKDAFSASASLDLVYNGTKNQLESLGGLLSPESGATPNILKFTRIAGKWSGSELVANALAEYGDVAHQRSGQVLAANGQPSAIQVADEITFVESSSVTNTVDIGSTTARTPGSRTVGFTASFLPMVTADNRILLQYTINLSSLLRLNRVGDDKSFIETPQIASQSLQQQAYVRDGETIVLFGFEQDHASTGGQAGLLSVGNLRGKDRKMLAIVMDITRMGR